MGFTCVRNSIPGVLVSMLVSYRNFNYTSVLLYFFQCLEVIRHAISDTNMRKLFDLSSSIAMIPRSQSQDQRVLYDSINNY